MVIRGKADLTTYPSTGWVIPGDHFLQFSKTGWDHTHPSPQACLCSWSWISKFGESSLDLSSVIIFQAHSFTEL